MSTRRTSPTPRGRGTTEGKATPFSKGLARGASPLKVVSGSGLSGADPKGFGGAPSGAPVRAAPTAAGGPVVRAVASGATVTALKPLTAEVREEASAYKRGYEERAKELAEDIAFEESANEARDVTETSPASALFSDAAAKEASDAKALAAERRQIAMMQGYTGNMCSECQNFTMVRNGTCEKCDTCGATSGCS